MNITIYIVIHSISAVNYLFNCDDLFRRPNVLVRYFRSLASELPIQYWTVTKDGWATANNGFCSAGFMIYFVALCNWNSKQRVSMMKFIR